MKIYLYHRKPKYMQGTILYPLNKLKDIYPEVWQREISKYDGREGIMDIKIMILDCLWNDVLHISPIHPRDLYEAWKSAGFEYHFEFFEIDVNKLNKENLAIYTYENMNSDFDQKRDFIDWNEDYILNNCKIRQSTIEYFKKCKQEEKAPLLFVGVPHVLYKGEIETKDLKIIKI